MTRDGNVVFYVFGEGKTDIGRTDDSEPPTKGVVPIVVSTLCGRPKQMRVQREPIAFLQGKGLWQKVRCAKRKAYYGKADAAVFVIDSEGDATLRKKMHAQVAKGRDAALPAFPMAVGVAQPCIESWLLTDPGAIRCGLNLASLPDIPQHPEELPAPSKNRYKSPKAVLSGIAGIQRQELSVENKDCIARAMNDMLLARERCPQSFAPFADEVENRIRPLF